MTAGPQFSTTWQALQNAQPAFADKSYQYQGAHWTLDLSTSGIDDNILNSLLQLAQDAKLAEARDAQMCGDIVNTSEYRAALHTALRAPDYDIPVAVKSDILACRTQMQELAADVATRQVTNIIHVGMGGSGLAPALLHKHFNAQYIAYCELHFITNMDPVTLARITKMCNPATTLVIIASKSFTTEETTVCMQFLRNWLGGHAARNMFAITAKPALAIAAGFLDKQILPMWDWVGGRFSLWSAVSFPIMLTYGPLLDACLAGAHDMDRHYQTAPIGQNLPFLLALAHIWQGSFMGCRSHALLPYADALALVPPYLQQLEMESNGKPGMTKTAPTIFGGVGTAYQHSFMQWMHEGTDIVSADIIIPMHSEEDNELQTRLVSNALAQSKALAYGQPPQFPGGRPSNVLLTDKMTPAALGALIALYEHKIFLQSRIWGINCFDQPAVELGKILARDILPWLQGHGTAPDRSTAARIARYTAAQS